ncbi:TetR/AcrR family transcriptional regulator [Martelella soudanensis]|uniref:TetR/AcrR family transcriptional regulator n=1 Tax=unclassified Martelella TaxID=2629616 RepID=UPI0015DD548E|nr:MULTISPECIES: TetR/AcrR family transcriptional regulator [unclassified Martelella]
MTVEQDVTSDETDHRVRVARKRRQRMRQRLLSSVLAICNETSIGGRPSVEAVIAHAQVSKATFYKYFTSVDEAIGTLGAEMVAEMVRSLVELLADSSEPPLFQMTTSIQLFLMRSVNEPLWADFVARRDALGGDSDARRGLERHISESFKVGLINIVNYESAVALAIGALMEGMRHIARQPNRAERSFVEGLLTQILRGLGVEDAAARDLVRDSAIFIRGAAPDRLQWWSDPWTT